MKTVDCQPENATKALHTTDEPIKWTAKMRESFAEAERGEWTAGDINNFWGNI